MHHNSLNLTNMLKKIIITIGSIGLMVAMMLLLRIIALQPFDVKDPHPTNVNWGTMLNNKEIYNKGKAQFVMRCYKCHGKKGEGNYRGPSLIDVQWKNGPFSIESIYEITRNGLPEKKKYGWWKKLKPAELQAITVYVYNIHNSK